MIKIMAGVLLIASFSIAHAEQAPDTLAFQERQCIARGWHAIVRNVDGVQRRILWKGPKSAWSTGAIVVMHGGGGHHFQFCVANTRITGPQVRFTERALSEGFAVFLLESTAQVTDNQGRLCGKVWDDEVRNRPNLDLPFIGEVIRAIIPNARPAGSRKEIFLTGLSSGGYMTLRAATHFADQISAFAPISSGDPYGWHRICEKQAGGRDTVHGAGFDNDTGKQIIERDACLSTSYRNEMPWDGKHISPKPEFRIFHHPYDGINDMSCAQRAITQLRRHHYPEVPAFLPEGNKHRSLENHLWQDDYNKPLLEFFKAQIHSRQKP